MSDERTRPSRIRISGLQEDQLSAVVEVERAATDIYYERGFDAAEVPTRAANDIVGLTKDHNVRVAEADREVAGYAAWRDESPGVAYVEEISVHPDYQRFGVGSKLMDAIREEAREAHLKHVVLKCFTGAPWAMAFYTALGFKQIDDSAPGKVQGWRDERVATGRPFTRPNQIALWAPVGEAPAPPPDDEDEPADDESA